MKYLMLKIMILIGGSMVYLQNNLQDPDYKKYNYITIENWLEKNVGISLDNVKQANQMGLL